LALRAFEQGGIFIVPHLLWHGTSVFPVSSEGPPHLVASYDTRGCGGSILTRILTGKFQQDKWFVILKNIWNFDWDVNLEFWYSSRILTGSGILTVVWKCTDIWYSYMDLNLESSQGSGRDAILTIFHVDYVHYMC
jgi:hypothetical protein